MPISMSGTEPSRTLRNTSAVSSCEKIVFDACCRCVRCTPLRNVGLSMPTTSRTSPEMETIWPPTY